MTSLFPPHPLWTELLFVTIIRSNLYSRMTFRGSHSSYHRITVSSNAYMWWQILVQCSRAPQKAIINRFFTIRGKGEGLSLVYWIFGFTETFLSNLKKCLNDQSVTWGQTMLHVGLCAGKSVMNISSDEWAWIWHIYMLVVVIEILCDFYLVSFNLKGDIVGFNGHIHGKVFPLRESW